jgi:hypothetical protein
MGALRRHLLRTRQDVAFGTATVRHVGADNGAYRHG